MATRIAASSPRRASGSVRSQSSSHVGISKAKAPLAPCAVVPSFVIGSSLSPPHCSPLASERQRRRNRRGKSVRSCERIDRQDYIAERRRSRRREMGARWLVFFKRSPQTTHSATSAPPRGSSASRRRCNLEKILQITSRRRGGRGGGRRDCRQCRARRDAASTPSCLIRGLGQSPSGNYALLPPPHSWGRRRDGTGLLGGAP